MGGFFKKAIAYIVPAHLELIKHKPCFPRPSAAAEGRKRKFLNCAEGLLRTERGRKALMRKMSGNACLVQSLRELDVIAFKTDVCFCEVFGAYLNVECKRLKCHGK